MMQTVNCKAVKSFPFGVTLIQQAPNLSEWVILNSRVINPCICQEDFCKVCFESQKYKSQSDKMSQNIVSSEGNILMLSYYAFIYFKCFCSSFPFTPLHPTSTLECPMF